MKSFTGYIKWLEYIVIGAIVFALITPLFLNTSYYFPYISSKIFVFRSVVEIGFAVYVFLALIDKNARPKLNFLFVSVTAYLFAITISSFFGVNFSKSFWGTVERGEGLVTFFHIYALFVMIIGVLREKRHWKIVLLTSFCTSVLTAFYAIGQLMGVSWIVNTTGARLSSTVGNSSFFAGYLLMNVFIGIYAVRDLVKQKWAQVLSVSGVLVNVFVIFQTQTRGAVLGLVIGILFLAIVSIIAEKNKKLRAMWASVVGLVLVLILSVIVFRDSAFIKESRALHRFANISLTDTTTVSRLLTWEASLKAFADRPVFGWGYENYNIAFDKYFPTPIYQDGGSQIWFDRAHNIALDQLVMFGVMGFVAYVVMIGGVLFVLIRRIRFLGYQKSYQSYALIALIIAYVTQNLFVFDTLPTQMTLYVLLGYVAWLTASRTEPSFAQPAKEGSHNKFAMSVAGVGLLVAVFGTLVPFNIKSSTANLIGAQGIREFGTGNIDKAFEYLEESFALDTGQTEEIKFSFVNKAIQSKKRLRENPSIGEKVYRKAQEYARDLIESDPLNARYYIMSMAVNNAAYGVFDTPIEEMEQLAQKAIERSPTRPHIYYELAQAYLNSDRYDDALNALSKARELSPKVGVVYRNLMLANSQRGDWEEVGRILQDIVRDDSEINMTSEDYDFIITLLGAGERFDDLIVFYEWLLTRGRDSGEDYAQLAALYAIVGRFDDARDAVRKAVRLDFSLEEDARKFMQILDEKEALSEKK